MDISFPLPPNTEGQEYTSGGITWVYSAAKGVWNQKTFAVTLEGLGGVPSSRTINDHPLTDDISLDHEDVGAAAASHTHAITDVTGLSDALSGKVATSITVNGYALSGNVTLSYSDVGAQPAGSYATLVDGHVPSSQLPSYVDDVIEVADFAHLPGTGETGKIYVTLDTNKTYRWSGSAYVEISASPGSTDAVPEGAVNKYYTDERAADAAPVQKVNNKTGDVSLDYSDVGAAPASHNHDDRYYTETETDTLLSGKSNTGHTHDDRYYTETETDTLLSGKSNTGHTHDDRYYTESETDTLLSGKSNVDHTHDDRYYTESETDVFLNLLRLHLTSGIVSGGALAINADPTKYNIAGGVGYVIDYWTNPGTPTVTKVEWANQTGLTSTYLNSSISTTVMINAAGSVVTQTDAPSRNNYSEYIVLGKLLHPNRAAITGISHYHHSISGSIGNAMDMMHFLGTMANGVNFTPNGANLHLDRSSGSLLRIGGNYTANKEAPNLTELLAQTPASFFYRYRDGSGGFKIDTPAVTAFNPDVYDDGSGTLATVNNNKFVNHRVYVFTSGNAYIVPGQTEYQNLNAAISALATEDFSVDPQLADANLRCVITAKKGVTSLLSADVNFTQGGTFGVLGGAAGGGGTTSPGGSAYDLQYNNNGTFGGAAITGLVKANGSSGAPSAAEAGVDYEPPLTLGRVGAVLGSADVSNAVADDDVVMVAKADKSGNKWVPWLSGIVTKARSYFIHLLGGQTIQSSTPTTTTLTLKAAVGQNGSNPMLSIVDGGGTQVASIGHTGFIAGATITTNEFRLGNRPFATQAANTLNLGSDTYWTTINYGNTSTVSHAFSANTVNASGLAQVMTIRLTSSNASPVNSGFGWSVYGTLEAPDGVVYGAGQFACLWQDAPNKLSAWEWSTRAGTVLRFNDTGLGINTNNPQSEAHVVVSSQTKKGLIVQLAASPLSNAIEVQSSTGTQLFYVTADGTVSSSRTIMATTGFQVAGSKAYTWDSRGVMSAPSDGVILLQNWATTDFSRLQFGGTTSLFPALKRVLAGLSVRTADDSADATLTMGNSNVNGMLTVLGNFTGSGTDNKLPNQTAANADSIMVRRLIREEVFRMLMWSRMEYRRLFYSGAVISSGANANGNSGNGSCGAGSGSSVNGKGMALLESGMSFQSGSGASWSIPNKFAFAGNAWFLMCPYVASVYNITAGGNTFTYALASNNYIGMRVWSPYFPGGTYVTAVSGTTITVSQNATGTMAGASTLTMTYMGVSRFFAAPAPINANNLQSFCYETPQCSYTARTTAGWAAGSTSVPLNSDLYQNCNWTSGATAITATASNSNIVAGMHVSGAGIPIGTTVVSVSGTTINLSQATTAGGTSYPVAFYSPNIVGMALSLTGLDPTITVTGMTNNRADGLLGAITLSAPLPANFAGGMEIGFRSLDTLYYRNNNGIGFEWRPDPATGICMFCIVIVRAGVVYYSSYGQVPEGAATSWQPYYQWILDYDETTLTARLFVSRQVAQNSIPSVQTAPIATLTMPAGNGIAGRGSGLQVALQCCANNERGPQNSSLHSIGTSAIDYFPDRTYPY